MPVTTEEKDGLIDRYLNNKLDSGERAAFELMMLEDEQLAARAQLLDAFKNSLIEERAALSVQREFPALPFRAWLRQPLSLAAAVLVAGLGLQVVYDKGSAAKVAQGPSGIASLLVVESTRGAAALNLSGTPPYLFQIDAGPDAANTAVTVTLRDSSGAELLRVENLPVDASGWARVVFPQPLAGAYLLELAPASDPSGARTFHINLSD